MNNIKDIFNRSNFFQNVAKLLSVNVVIQVVAFVLSIFIARLYSQNDFGILAKFMSVAGIFILFATSRFEFAIILPKKDDEANALLRRTQRKPYGTDYVKV